MRLRFDMRGNESEVKGEESGIPYKNAVEEFLIAVNKVTCWNS